MSPSENCVFCRIVQGAIPCLKIHEDSAVLAFLDIGPLADGHLLVIPKEHFERPEQMSEEAFGGVMKVVPRLAKAVLRATGADAYNVLLNAGRAASQEVMHLHVHVIPRRHGDGLGYRWLAKRYEAGRGERLAQEVLQALKSV